MTTQQLEHNQQHGTAQYFYKDKLIFTTDLKNIDLDETKHTITFNKDKTRAWHFFVSKDIFFKWEAPFNAQEAPESVKMIINNTEGIKNERNYWPKEVKEKK